MQIRPCAFLCEQSFPVTQKKKFFYGSYRFRDRVYSQKFAQKFAGTHKHKACCFPGMHNKWNRLPNLDNRLLATFFSTLQWIVRSPNICSESFAKALTNIAWESLTHSDSPVQNGWHSHKKLAIICAFSLVFNEIALNPIDSPLVPLFNVEYVRLSNRFCGHNNIEMGRRGKRKQRCPRLKNSL